VEALTKPPMAADPKARKISIGFPGGSITATRGLLEAVFGAGLVQSSQYGSATVSVDGHSRTRVIGGPTTAVRQHNFTLQKFPTGPQAGGSGGEPIRILYEGKWWTARLQGSHQALNDWLQDGPGVGVQPRLWKSEKGTPYGPFQAGGLTN